LRPTPDLNLQTFSMPRGFQCVDVDCFAEDFLAHQLTVRPASRDGSQSPHRVPEISGLLDITFVV
jgi:hypothetical protein